MTYTQNCQQEGHIFCSPYYDPEHYGLSIVGVVEEELSYEFDMFVIWTDGETYYWASDSGCSCPIPFEDTELIAGTARDALIDLEAWVKAGLWEYNDTNDRLGPYEQAKQSTWFRDLLSHTA